MIKLVEVIMRTTTDEDSYSLALELGLIKNQTFCCVCGTGVGIEKGKRRHGIDGRFRCLNRNCRKCFSIFSNSIFHYTKLPLGTVIRIVYLHCLGINNVSIADELDVGRDSVCKIIEKFYENVEATDPKYFFGKLGSHSGIVEIDETHLCTRRDNRGRILAGERYWLIGGIDRSTRNIHLQVVRRRTKAICNDFIRSHVEPNTHIMTDMWRGYNDLSRLGFLHSKVNHRNGFVNPIDGNINTQMIERLWKSFKAKYRYNNNFDTITSKAKRFVFEYNLSLKTASSKFCVLCDFSFN